MALVKPGEICLRQRVGALSLSLLALVGWLYWVGLPRPGTVVAPAGDPALCWAVAACWSGLGVASAQRLWAVGLLLCAAFTGVAPFWTALLGLPVWLWTAAQSREVALWRFIVTSSFLMSVVICGGKLLLLSWVGTSVTLSGPSLASSFLAELAPNLLFLSGFSLLWGGRLKP